MHSYIASFLCSIVYTNLAVDSLIRLSKCVKCEAEAEELRYNSSMRPHNDSGMPEDDFEGENGIEGLLDRIQQNF